MEARHRCLQPLHVDLSYLGARSEGVGEEVDPLAQSSLQQRQNIRERGLNIVATVVHQFTEEI